MGHEVSQHRHFGDKSAHRRKLLPGQIAQSHGRTTEEPVGTRVVAPRHLVSVGEAAQRLAVGRSTVYAMVKSGELESVTIGRLRSIPIDSLEAFLSSLEIVPIGAAGLE